jgi:GNAT superfamily N-acetyltransferase
LTIVTRPTTSMYLSAPWGPHCVAPCDAGVLEQHAPDRHLTATDATGRLLARASVWWMHTPCLEGQHVGVIGHYAAATDGAGGEILRRACHALTQAGCDVAVGPMDGSTWRPYRFVIDRGKVPTFFLEPDHPDDWPRQFVCAGFAPLATYVSAIAGDLTAHETEASLDEADLAASGTSIRCLDLLALDRELRRIRSLCLDSFRDNFLYAPIGDEEFRQQQHSLLPFVRPDLVLLAERAGELVGFVLAVPDLPSASGELSDTIVIKTVAVAPAMRRRRLGHLLVSRVQQRAAAQGFRRAVHALMHEDNASVRISRHYAGVFRRYALFARELKGAGFTGPGLQPST